MVLKGELRLEIWRSGRQRSLKTYHDPRQVPLSKPDSAGPGQDRVWRGQVGGSGWEKLHPGGLVAAAAVAPRHRSAASESLPGPAAGKDRRLNIWTGPGSAMDSRTQESPRPGSHHSPDWSRGCSSVPHSHSKWPQVRGLPSQHLQCRCLWLLWLARSEPILFPVTIAQGHLYKDSALGPATPPPQE